MDTEQPFLEPVLIEVLSMHEHQDRKLTGAIQDRASKALTVVTTEEVAESSSIRVQSKHLLILGDVLSCVRQSDPDWVVRIRIRNSFLVV